MGFPFNETVRVLFLTKKLIKHKTMANEWLIKEAGKYLAYQVTCQDHSAGEQQGFKSGLDMWSQVCTKDNSSVISLHS